MLPKATTVIDSDSDDEVILPKKVEEKPEASNAAPRAPAQQQNGANISSKAISDSDDDVPLVARMPTKPEPATKPAPIAKKPSLLDDAEELPSAPKPKTKPVPKPAPAKMETDSDSDDDVPLAQRRKSLSTSGQLAFML